MNDGIFCAAIPLLKGCKAYGATAAEAMEELAGVKETLLRLMIEQKKIIPEPTIRLEIPISEYSRFPNKKRLQRFIRTTD